MRSLLNFLLSGTSLLLLSCSSIPARDLAPAPIEVGLKRAEIEICGQRRIGENGCLYTKGEYPIMRIRRIAQGIISLVGSACQLDQSVRYSDTGPPWIDFELAPFLQRHPNCQIDIYQYVIHPHQDEYPHPIRGFRGTAIVSECPANTTCSFSAVQVREKWEIPDLILSVPGEGKFTVEACGARLMESSFKHWVYVNSDQLGKIEARDCLFTVAAKSSETRALHQYKVGRFSELALPLAAPSFEWFMDKLLVRADPAVSLVEVDGEFIANNVFFFKPSGDIDELRFYTMQGRSLLVRVRYDRIISME